LLHIRDAKKSFDEVRDGRDRHIAIRLFFGTQQVIVPTGRSFGNFSFVSEDVEEKETGKKKRAFISTPAEKGESCGGYTRILAVS